jgi:hypothetical protein
MLLASSPHLMPKKYPKKGLGSYIVPFLLIMILVASGAYILQNRVDFADVKRIFMPPEVAKDEKVTLVFQQGNNEVKAWNKTSWDILSTDSYLQAGDTVKTGEGSAMVLRFFDESEIRLDKSSQMKLIRLDKDPITGNHLAVEMISGQAWGRIMKPNVSDGDFIINTAQQLIHISDDSLVNASTNPESTRVIGGDVLVNIAEVSNGTRRPVARLDVKAGQQLTLDQLTIDQLKSDERDILVPLSETFLKSEWYEWNTDKEDKLGSHVTIAAVEVLELEALEDGLITVTSHKEGSSVSGKTLIQGNYDSEKITDIYVNGVKAILGLSGEWESAVNLTEQNQKVTILAKEVSSDTKKEALTMTFKVDATGPALGNVTQPAVDENGNGTLEGDKLELIGEVSNEAQSVCVSHNDGTPYCLKQFSPGDSVYKYIGAISYGNVIKGKNKYTITATDSIGNINSKTVYIFKDEEKPSSKIIEETISPSTTSSGEISTPVILVPDPAEVLQVTDSILEVSGTVDTASKSLLVNGKKASYKAGTADFSLSLDLSEGENIIKIQSLNASGDKSKTALLTVIYLEKVEEEEN